MISEEIEDPFQFATENDLIAVVNSYLSNANRFKNILVNNPTPLKSANVIGKNYIYELINLRDNRIKAFFNKNQDCIECHKLTSDINHMISSMRGVLYKKFGSDSADSVGGRRKYKSRRYRKTIHRRNQSYRRK